MKTFQFKFFFYEFGVAARMRSQIKKLISLSIHEYIVRQAISVLLSIQTTHWLGGGGGGQGGSILQSQKGERGFFFKQKKFNYN